jgi:hypothetical protein
VENPLAIAVALWVINYEYDYERELSMEDP